MRPTRKRLRSFFPEGLTLALAGGLLLLLSAATTIGGPSSGHMREAGVRAVESIQTAGACPGVADTAGFLGCERGFGWRLDRLFGLSVAVTNFFTAAEDSDLLRPVIEPTRSSDKNATRAPNWLNRAIRLLSIPLVWLIGLYCVVSGAIWLARPFWLVNLSTACQTEGSLPDPYGKWFGIFCAILVKPYLNTERVLDAWVAEYFDTAQKNFEELPAVKDRKDHVPVPVSIDGKVKDKLEPDSLKPKFNSKRICLLIKGEGGSGMTSLACLLARWAMKRRLSPYRMLPVFIDQALDVDEQNNLSLIQTVRGRLETLIESHTVPNELLKNLLRRGRILVIVDHFSEFDEATRKAVQPTRTGFPVQTLVLTSRKDEFANMRKTVLEPQRIGPTKLIEFLRDYLVLKGMRGNLTDQEWTAAAHNLTQMVGSRAITPLLAKLYADHLASKEQSNVPVPVESLRDLMLRYVRQFNENASKKYTNEEVLCAVKAAAWECLERQLTPEAVPRSKVIGAIQQAESQRRTREQGESSSSAEQRNKNEQSVEKTEVERLLTYLEKDLWLIETSDLGDVPTIRFSLDPLAEFLAGTYLVEMYGGHREKWEKLIERAKQKKGDSGRIQGFLLALRDCCVAETDKLRPTFVIEDLTELAEIEGSSDTYEYYRDYVRCRGIPQGIGKLSKAEARCCQVAVRMRIRDGVVRLMQIVNGSGRPAALATGNVYISPAATDASPPECRWEFDYDESQILTRERGFDQAGRLVYSCDYSGTAEASDHPAARRSAGTSAPNTKGGTEISSPSLETMVRYYVDLSDIARPRAKSGASFVRISRTVEGFDKLYRFYDGSERLQPDDKGCFGKEFHVGGTGQPLQETCLGPTGEPIFCSDRYAILKYEYDSDQKCVAQSYHDPAGKPLLQAEGFHKATFVYDVNGNTAEARFSGLDGQPTLTNSGFFRWSASYDKLGNQTEQEYWDASGNLVVIARGYAKWVGSFDDRGNSTGVEFRDTAGAPTRSQDGFAAWTAKYNDAGESIEVSFWDAAGKPTRNQQGIARFTRRYDDYGCVSEEIYFGPDGVPTRDKEGIGGWRGSYDGRRNLVEQAFLDTSGMPGWNKDGISKWRAKYDERGNRTEIAYFGSDNQPVLTKDAYHRQVSVYDDHGNRTETRFFDHDGNPTYYQGYSVRRMKYDDFGRVIQQQFFDAAERLSNHRGGYSRVEWKYDVRGNQLEESYLGPDNKPVRTREGYARCDRTYNDRGHCVGEAFFDEEDRPVAIENQMAKRKARHNERGQVVEQSFFDVNGKPALNVRNVVHWKANYDQRGNQIEVCYFDADGKPSLAVEKYTRWTAKYNDRGDRVEQCFWIGDVVVAQTDGIGGITWKYDDRGNQKEEAYFSPVDHPVKSANGFARRTANYDDRDNRIEQRNWDENGKAIEVDGVASWTAIYDARNRQTINQFYRAPRADGEGRCPNCGAWLDSLQDNDADLVYRITNQYDELDNRVEQTFFGKWDVARYRRHYDRWGNQTEEVLFDPSGKRKLQYDKEITWSRWVARHDPYGRPVQRTYFDCNDLKLQELELELDIQGNEIDKVIVDYDGDNKKRSHTYRNQEGWVIETTFLNAASQPVAAPDGRIHVVEKRDLDGNRLEIAYFDASGQLTPYKGHLRSRTVYDRYSNLVLATYVFLRSETEVLEKLFRFGPGRSPRLHFESHQGADKPPLSNEAIALQYNIVKDQVYHYGLAIHSEQRGTVPDFQQTENDTLLHIRQRVTAVNPDGSCDLEVLTERRSENEQGTISQLEPVQVRMCPTGKILWSSVEVFSNTIPFPAHPVFTGESWESEIKLRNLFVKDKVDFYPLTFCGTLSGIQAEAGYDCAHIQMRCLPREFEPYTGVRQMTTGVSEQVFAFEEGIMLRSKLQTETIMTTQEGNVQTIFTITMELNPAPKATPRPIGDATKDLIPSGP